MDGGRPQAAELLAHQGPKYFHPDPFVAEPGGKYHSSAFVVLGTAPLTIVTIE